MKVLKYSAFFCFIFFPLLSRGEDTVKPQAAISFGSTSNATLLNDPTPGIYAKIAPSIGAEFSHSDTLSANVNLSGTLKRFQNQSVSSLADETNGEFKSDLIWSVNDSWEVGGNFSTTYLENHIPIIGNQTVEAQMQRYYQPDLRLYGAWLGDLWSLEVGTSITTRRYSTTTFDLEGNVFRNTYDEYGFDGKVNYRWSKDTRLSFKAKFEQRSYAERMAEFTDGLPAYPGTMNPLLSTLASDNEAQLKTRVAATQLTSSLSARFEKDQVFGARDSFRWKFRQKASLPLPLSLTFEPEASVARQAFASFRSDPLNNPQGSDLRVDWDLQIRMPLTLDLSKTIKAQAQYAMNRKLSNYTILNYTENLVETGISMQF